MSLAQPSSPCCPALRRPAILFGGFKAGGALMQTSQGIPIEIVTVVQSLIVLFIAAPPLVRSIFRIPPPGAFKTAGKRSTKKANAAGGAA